MFADSNGTALAMPSNQPLSGATVFLDGGRRSAEQLARTKDHDDDSAAMPVPSRAETYRIALKTAAADEVAAARSGDVDFHQCNLLPHARRGQSGFSGIPPVSVRGTTFNDLNGNDSAGW